MGQEQADKLHLGSSIGHYRIISKIGAGGMGEVFLAQDTKLDRKVAIKILPREFAEDKDRMSRFVREAKSASALNHPNIITTYEFSEQEGKHLLVLEYVKGKTLRELISERNKLELTEALEITIQIASALQAAHAAGIIHRDIKPENIMIRDDGYVKVLDFGLAKLTGPTGDSVAENATPVEIITQAGRVMGSPPYMSPEQACSKEVDARSDIWSIGVVLYELLAGRSPFSGVTINHTLVAVLEKDPPPMRSFDVSIPADLEIIISRALAKKASNRYQNATQLIDDLRTLVKRLEFEAELEKTSEPNVRTILFKEKTSPGMASSYPTGEASAFPIAMFDNSKIEQTETFVAIAVMPFVNMSPNEDGDYLSDGISEELINVLSKIRGLRVAARTSSFSFKGKQRTIAEIGNALNVGSILEGSVRIAGSKVRISVQLVNVEDGYHLWSQTYDRAMGDIFEVQDDIAFSVLSELRDRLLGRETGSGVSTDGRLMSELAQAARGRATNPEAQRLMLLGRYFLDRTTKEDTEKAISYFKKALDLDKNYALCWAELGRAYSIQAGRVWVPAAQGFELSREATQHALSLEPDLAEGHAQLGRIQLTHDWDFKGAAASYKRAVNLAPWSSSVLDGAAMLAYKVGRLDEALQLNRRVSALDPLSAAFWHNLGLTCHAAGRLAEAENAFRRSLELAPQRFVSNALLALVLMDQGKTEEAFAHAQREPYEMWRLWALVILNHAAGKKVESDELFFKLTAEHASGNAYQIAEIHSIRSELDLAFEWLGKALQECDSGLTHAKTNPRFQPLHSDPKWTVLLKKIGFDV